MRKTAGLLSVLLLGSIFFAQQDEASADTELQTNIDTVSLTEERTVEVSADLGSDVDLENVEFTFGGRALEEWRQHTGGTSYNGSSFIQVTEGPYLDEDGLVRAEIEFGLLYGTDNLAPRNIRTQYQQFINDYELTMTDTQSGASAETTLRYNVYDEFLFYDELKPAIDDVLNQASDSGRYVQYEKVGESVEGRDIHFAVVARDEAAVDRYFDETLPQALNDPAALKDAIASGEAGDYQVPVWFNNIHPDEVEGVDAQIELFRDFALEEDITFMNTDDTEEFEVTMNVDEALDDVIMLYMFTSNPDGRAYNTRGNAEGFDLNRDNAYQTQVETQAVNELVSEWTPLSFIDIHGYVNGFLIEPATPPHNPNFEYDLLIDNMLEQAHALGRGGISNSNLDSYFIPKLDWEDGWDDMTPSYTAMYGMLHGAYSHTVEAPTLSQDSYRAMVGSSLGAIDYVLENKDELYTDQLSIFERGVNNEDDRSVDEHFVNAAGESIGRVRDGNDNFFPDYYVIPADESAQKNVLEAYNMADYLIRNSIEVEQLTADTEIDGVTYPEGSFVVPMNQAKRGLANAMLYEGDNVSDWNAMYDPIVINFPALRGFDMTEVRDEGALDGLTEQVEEVAVPNGSITGNPPRQILHNNTNDAVRIVNELLADGKTVEMFTDSRGNASEGDYLVETADLREFADEYYFNTEPYGNGRNAGMIELSQQQVAATGSDQLDFSLRQLGFELTDADNADVIVSDSGSFDPELAAGKSFIGIGVNALNSVRSNAGLPGFNFDFTQANHEGLFEAELADHPVNAGYESEELMYTTTGSWITDVPEEADVLATFADSDDFYQAGWWPGNDRAQGQYMSFTAETDDTSFTLFANSLAFRAHTEHSYRMLANSIYQSGTTESERTHPGRGQSAQVEVEGADAAIQSNKPQGNVSAQALERAAEGSAVSRLAAETRLGSEGASVTFDTAGVQALADANPDAVLDVTAEGVSHAVSVQELPLEELDSAGTITIDLTVETETISQREEEDRIETVTTVTVSADDEDILSYPVLSTDE
ncbi:M14 family metallopeptidase [Bacillus daqingensis]|uniref:M14 family metallopeptidase n=1 Tax=Bacillus daqingensis TaxID=872396 RepID=A0ABV9NTF0_9BACI